MGVSRVARGLFDPPILPPAAAARLSAADRHLVRHRRILEDPVDRSRLFRPGRACGAFGREGREPGADQRRPLYGGEPGAGRPARRLAAALPDILVGLRIGMGVGWTTLVAAEMVAANAGLGQMVLNASNFLCTDVVILGVIVIGIVTYAFELGMRLLERRLAPWKGRM